MPSLEVTLPAPDLGRMGRERLARLRHQMTEQGLDALVLLHGPHVAYATGHVPPGVDATHAAFERAVAVVTPDAVALHAARPSPLADEVTTGRPLWPELDDGMDAFGSAIRAVVGDTAGRRIGVDEITGAMQRSAVLADAELADAGRVLAAARVVKTPDELDCIELAQRRNEIAMEPARDACIPGARRSEIAGAFLRRARELGAGDTNMIDPIFERVPRRRDHGPRTSTGHIAFPTGVDDTRFMTGDLVWVDAGMGHAGYMSDFGRTWVVGRDPNAAERELFARWTAVMDAAQATIRPGVTLGDVGRAAAAADPPETPWLPHFYLAHAVGVESAEMPMIGSDLGDAFDDGYVLEPGMVLVLEPVAWQDGVGGYRAEEIIAVTDDGWRLLGAGHHHLPFEPASLETTSFEP